MIAVFATILVVFIIVRKSTVVDNATSAGNGDCRSPNHLSRLLETLESLGFYQYVAPEQIDDLKQEALATGYIFGWEGTARDYEADAENLAEGGVHEFLAKIAPFLTTQGVQIDSIEEHFRDTGYRITINGREYELYSGAELASANIWELTTTRAFGIVNTLLREAGSSERVFVLYGGNDLHAVFLTTEMYEVLRRAAVLPPQEMPMSVPEL